MCTARHSLAVADRAATADPTRIPTLSTRQRNALRLHEALVSMQRVVQGRLAIVALLEVEDYFSAIELIAAAKKVYHEQLSGISHTNLIFFCSLWVGTNTAFWLFSMIICANLKRICNKLIELQILSTDFTTLCAYWRVFYFIFDTVGTIYTCLLRHSVHAPAREPVG